MVMKTSVMLEIQSWLHQNQDLMADELEQLCNINSGSNSVDGLNQTANWLIEYFSPLRAPAQIVDLPTFETIDDLGHFCTHTTGSALRWDLGSSPGKSARRLLLTIHYDTVYGPESPFQKCTRFEAEDANGTAEKRLNGPGVIDAKGGIIVMRWAALAAQRFLDLSKINISLVLTPDEEIGSPASTCYWESIAKAFDFAMLFEPALPDGSLVSRRKGTGTFVIIVRGKSAHSGRNFHDGKNAIVLASRVAIAIDALNGQRPDVTLNVGRIRGGNAVNVVPDLAVIRVNVRVIDREDQHWVESQLQCVVELHNNFGAGYSVELCGGVTSAPKSVDAMALKWMHVVEQAGDSIDEQIRWHSSGGASDGSKLAALGLPNIDSFGPEGGLLHSDQEWVRLSSLPRKAALSAAVIEKVSSESTC